MRAQLKAKSDEVEKLRQEKTRLEADLANAHKAAAAAAATAAAPEPAVSALPPAAVAGAAESETSEPEPSYSTATESSSPTNPPLFAAGGFMPARPSWIVALAAAIAALAIGFALGWRMLDRRIRAKYGGLRIY
jgi:hypothetical protein